MDKAIEFYNNRRPHDSLESLVPMEAIGHTGGFKRRWKSWREEAIDSAFNDRDKEKNKENEEGVSVA